MSLSQEFTASSRVCAHIYYMRPLQIGQNPLSIASDMIGQKPAVQNHSVLLQSFIYQNDDEMDLSADLKKIFERTMRLNQGIVKIYDRQSRLGVMSEVEQLRLQRKLADGTELDAATIKAVEVSQVIVPSVGEEIASGEQSPSTARFKTLIPYPRLRRFLQKWQQEFEAPLHHIQFAAGQAAKATYSRVISEQRFD